MRISHAAMQDLDALAQVEAQCFPPAEAASRAALAGRLAAYPEHFWLLWDGPTLVGFVNGMTTDCPDLEDRMYADAALHDEGGRWQMIFGVDTIPAYRRRGCAGLLLRQAIADARSQGRAGLVLTCKEALVHYYAGFGFVQEGLSASSHGGAVWYQMRLRF